MIPATQSYLKLKKEQQEILDFSVLICHAVPNIINTIDPQNKQIGQASIPDPDYTNKEIRLLHIAEYYKQNLSKYILISAFSFFEFYIKSVILELISFHNIYPDLKYGSTIRPQSLSPNQDLEITKYKRKLQEPYKKKNHKKYEKYIQLLNNNPKYIRPSVLLGQFVNNFYNKDKNELSSEFKIKSIPKVLKQYFLMDLNEKVNTHTKLKNQNLKETFHFLYDIRNDIAHGENPTLCFNMTNALIRFLRQFSKRIDKHFVEHFFILENVDYNS